MNNNFDFKKLTPFKWFVLENFPFIEADFDALTEWQLFCKLGKEINKVIDSQNIVGEQAENLTNAFNTLKDYVDNYFENLDVQDEINNKLNEMVADGSLQEIIGAYLSIKSLLAFDNIEELKNSDNIVSGSYARTLGFYNLFDGGGAIYKIRTITNQDVVNNKSIIPLNKDNLIAELVIEKEVCLKQLGAKNNEDISEILQFAIDLCEEKYNLIIDDLYILSNTININKPITMKGLPSLYSNFGMCGFNCNNNENIVYFNFNEGSANCLIEHLNFNNNGNGICIKFSSRDESLTNYRVWKNQFNKCRFNNFDTALLFYAIGNIGDYDYSSEMLFIDCKFYNNKVCCEYNNVQSYNTNFIATDFESDPEHMSKGFILNSYGGININGGSIILHNSLIELGSNESLIPVNTFIGIINISNCRFETFNETIFNYTLQSRTANYQQHSLNINNTDFYTHEQNGTLIDCNVRGLKVYCQISLTGGNNLKVNGQSQQSANDYSTIIINTSQPERIITNYINGQYCPWIIINGTVKSSCINIANNKNYFEYNNKLYLGYNKTNRPSTFSINVPWYYRKFVININGGFVNNTGSITISNNNGFTHTFTKDVAGYQTIHDEVYLPYNADGQEFTITSDNLWGNCYFE